MRRDRDHAFRQPVDQEEGHHRPEVHGYG
nr:hypothetical protein [Desulfitobacterium dehalogenans]